MKKLLLFLLLTSVFYSKNYGQLVAGDIGFIGFQFDTPDGFTFITLTNMSAKEQILHLLLQHSHTSILTLQ